MCRLVTANRAKFCGTTDILYPHNLSVLQPELPAVAGAGRRVLADYTLDSIDDDFVGSITDPMDVL